VVCAVDVSKPRSGENRRKSAFIRRTPQLGLAMLVGALMMSARLQQRGLASNVAFGSGG